MAETPLPFDSLPIAMAECYDGVQTRTNAAWRALFGYDSAEELADIPLLGLIERADHARVKQHFRRTGRHEQDTARLELVAVRRNGTRIAVEMWIADRRTDTGDVALLVARNDTTNKNIEARLRFLDERDPLTGLFNRDYFLRALGRRLGARNRDAPVNQVMLVELRALKDVVRGHGYAAGDRLVARFARQLALALGSADIGARLADDEFGVLLAAGEAPADRAQALESRLREYAAGAGDGANDARFSLRSVALTDEHNNVGAVFAALRPAETPVRLIKPEVRVAIAPPPRRSRDCVERVAIALRQEQLKVYYQPIVGLNEDANEMYDADAGMPDPLSDPVADSACFNALHAGPNADDVARWLLRHALKRLGELRARGRDVAFLIPLPAHAALASELRDLLSALNIPAGKLLIALIASGTPGARDAIAAIAATGCGIVLDDFDTGFDVDTGTLPIELLSAIRFVRIDNRRVARMLNQDHDRSGADALFARAQALGHPVIVRNVEQATQLAELWRYGVARVQGEYFQTPSEDANYDFGTEHIEAGGVGGGWRGPP